MEANNCPFQLLVFFTAPGLAWQPALKTTKVKLDLLTNTDMLLTVEKGHRGGILINLGIFTIFINMEKLITNT